MEGRGGGMGRFEGYGDGLDFEDSAGQEQLSIEIYESTLEKHVKLHNREGYYC